MKTQILFAYPPSSELEAIEVTVRSSYLERSGFYRRINGAGGRQFTLQDLETIDPFQVSDLLRRVPGVTESLDPSNPNRAYAVSRRSVSINGGLCGLDLYIDAVRQSDANLNQVPPEWIEAIEIYSGVSTPAEYGAQACGVVLVWTRR